MDREQITWKGKTLAFIVRDKANPEKTTFLTPSDLNLQMGFVVYPADGQIPRHVHHPTKRQTTGTSEVLIVKKGRCLIDIYSSEQELVGSHELRTGDVVLLVDGGHGLRMLEDTIFLEVKQGPYTGMTEKIRF